MLVSGSDTYISTAFDSEEEIERVVFDNAEALFGPSALYLPKSRISTSGRKITVPDGIVVDLQSNQWYLVEAERASHGTWDHIAPQISAQLTALLRDEMKEKILQAVLDSVKSSEESREIIRELEIPEIELHGRVAAILKRPPVVAIPIDDLAADLEDWASNLKNSVKIWVLKKYVQQGGSRILYSLPDEATPTLDTTQQLSTTRDATPSGSAIRKVIAADLLRIGQELWMDYGPKGQPKQRFLGIVKEDGIEVDGRVYSPSYAAVACMRKAGGNRKTANGWLHWRTEDGTLIDDLYRQFQSRAK